MLFCPSVYKGGATKASWQSAPVVFNQYCAWDWRNPEHVLELPDKSSLCIEVWSHPTTRGQKEELAGSVFLDDDSPVEGWKRLEMTSGAAAMGFAFVRVVRIRRFGPGGGSRRRHALTLAARVRA